MLLARVSVTRLGDIYDPVMCAAKKGSAEFFVKEDDSYRVSFTNLNPGVVTVEMRINLTSKMYVTNDATTNCSSLYGVCNLKHLLPDTNYVVILSSSHNVKQHKFNYLRFFFVILYRIIKLIITCLMWLTT